MKTNKLQKNKLGLVWVLLFSSGFLLTSDAQTKGRITPSNQQKLANKSNARSDSKISKSIISLESALLGHTDDGRPGSLLHIKNNDPKRSIVKVEWKQTLLTKGNASEKKFYTFRAQPQITSINPSSGGIVKATLNNEGKPTPSFCGKFTTKIVKGETGEDNLSFTSITCEGVAMQVFINRIWFNDGTTYPSTPAYVISTEDEGKLKSLEAEIERLSQGSGRDADKRKADAAMEMAKIYVKYEEYSKALLKAKAASFWDYGNRNIEIFRARTALLDDNCLLATLLIKYLLEDKVDAEALELSDLLEKKCNN